MKKIALLILMMALLGVPSMFAQSNDDYNHGDLGLHLNYMRLKHADLNMFGVGGRVGFNVHPNVSLEADLSYDFRQNRNDSVTVGAVTTNYRSDLRTLTGLFGPKFHSNGPVRVYGTVKGGILNFSVSTTGAPLGFTNTVRNIADGDTNGVVYPAGGIEAYAGWFGVRAEAGDVIYFDRGANHNFRFTIGPQFRF
jgi:hypothetical protein